MISKATPKKKRRMTHESFKKMRQKANDGDPKALKMLRQYMDDFPEIWKEVGDLARHAQEAFIQRASDGDELVKESIRRKGAQLKKQLLGERPTAAQKLAAERVFACWLETAHLDRLHPEPSGTIQQASFVLRLRESAQKRLDKALKSLAELQKLQGTEKPREQRKGRNAQPLQAGDGAAMPANRVRLFMDREETVEAEV